MPELNSEHIAHIRQDIERSGVRNNLLKNELVDHICCRIEEEMTEGLSFQEAYEKTSPTYTSKDLIKTRRNRNFLVNYNSIITNGLIYLSILLYLLSWITHFSTADWFGLTAFLLISLIFLRYSVIFAKDATMKNHKLFSVLSGTVFVFYIPGTLFRFLWLSYGIKNPHVMPMLLFSWLILAALTFLYYHHFYKASSRNRARTRILIYMSIAAIHLLLAAFSMSSLFFSSLQQYIPTLASVIIALDLLFFISVVFIRQNGKELVKAMLLSSFMMVFLYFPLKSMVQPEVYSVQFRAVTRNYLPGEHLYCHVNYFKYGKETLVLKQQNDSVYQSKPIPISGGNIEMACKITRKRLDVHEVLYDSKIKEHRFWLPELDTTFTITYNP